jgi:predicted RNA-binding protein with PIN domain
MPYLIDGHNLIPFMHGISLDQLDDEIRLIDILDAYFRRIRKKAVVFFDQGQPGGNPEIKRGFVTARFTRPPLIADQAIRNKLKQSGGAARNFTVVSSDQEVASFAQHKGARAISSREFALTVQQSGRSRSSGKAKPEDDLDYWLKQFGENS